MKPINIVNKFITEEECDILINYINNNYEDFSNQGGNGRYIKGIGKETYSHGCGLGKPSKWSDLKEAQYCLKDILKRIEDNIESTYESTDNKITLIWISKYTPGSSLRLHNDSDGGRNLHFRYSGILYLNTTKSGQLEFPDRKIIYMPTGGDLVTFASLHKDNSHLVHPVQEDRYAIAFWTAHERYSIWKYLESLEN